ncbi:nitroreductase/quinone reductase family protein [Rubrobacter radiotolerans]|uniref:nitroreductase/quinone reductase family protein n=1 Tax=Rubrobacter radiotolerans TaxID=42256 RepID=UPI000A023831
MTTTGRVTGRPHEIEIWFALVPERRVLYVLSGGRDRSDWVRNLLREPRLTLSISGVAFRGKARFVEGRDEDQIARDLLIQKYESAPGSLSSWRERSLPIAIDLA